MTGARWVAMESRRPTWWQRMLRRPEPDRRPILVLSRSHAEGCVGCDTAERLAIDRLVYFDRVQRPVGVVEFTIAADEPLLGVVDSHDMRDHEVVMVREGEETLGFTSYSVPAGTTVV